VGRRKAKRQGAQLGVRSGAGYWARSGSAAKSASRTPELRGGGPPRDKREDYDRAYGACLTGRGYTVKTRDAAATMSSTGDTETWGSADAQARDVSRRARTASV
jgi:hypothetical protein